MTKWQEAAFAPDARGKAATLAVLVHGLRGSGAQLGSVADAAVAGLGIADIYMPRMAYAGLNGLFSATPPAAMVCDLIAAIDALDGDRAGRLGTGYDRIVLIGYSMGAIVVRKVAVMAHGICADAPFEPGYDPCTAGFAWAARIERVILLGGISKGWSPRAAGNWLTAMTWNLWSLVATLLPTRHGMLMECRFGLPFPVQTRLQWLALIREKQRRLPVIQLLGSCDQMVSPDDMIDVAVDGAAEKLHVLMDVPATNHRTAIHMGDEPGSLKRRELFIAALREDVATLAASPDAISSALLADGKTPVPEDEVSDVVFVVHGIRDKGYWTMKVARAIKREAEHSPQPDGSPRRVRSMTESYGYLAMLPFLWVGVRRMKAAWLMDRYVEARARYPKAAFHFVGHSNGTYLAARALRDYPAARFDRIVFAGSVVRSDYEWRTLIDAPQPRVRGLLNYVASNDLVVGIFPAALRWVDLGGAGHVGFSDIGPRPAPAEVGRIVPRRIGGHDCYQVNYVRGGHGAGIVETQWDEIARFIVRGEAPAAVNSDYVGRQSGIVRLLGARPPFGLLLVVLIYAGLVAAAIHAAPVLALPLAVLTLLILLRV